MSHELMDRFSASQKVVKVFEVTGPEGEKILLYEVKFSNLGDVINGALQYIKEDSKKYKKFVILFNARYIDNATHFSDYLYNILSKYKDLFLDERLHKFAIVVDNFQKHKIVIEAYDKLFDDPQKTQKEKFKEAAQNLQRLGGKLRKYEYFSTPNLDIVRNWLVT